MQIMFHVWPDKLQSKVVKKMSNGVRGRPRFACIEHEKKELQLPICECVEFQ